jgi:hypothetical protein
MPETACPARVNKKLKSRICDGTKKQGNYLKNRMPDKIASRKCDYYLSFCNCEIRRRKISKKMPD